MGSPTTARHLKSRELPIEPHLLNVQRQREDMPGVTARLYRIRYRSRIVSDTRSDAVTTPLFRIFKVYLYSRSQAVSRARRISQTSKYLLSFCSR
ncbi:protein of unknown function [Nitrospira defluvii]|jgi:hypothetical protein|uniref:Uncharacterized protein n=1 Tax=Nitrospira defluvii TaxID=330214 RepID=D8PC66_9BACT|nr:protein of unknown function [Nitrospira defluvii]